MLLINLCFTCFQSFGICLFIHLALISIMPRGRDLTDFERGQIYALKFIAEWPLRQISNVLHINYESIKKYCQRIPGKQREGTSLSTDRKRKCGRSRCTTERQDRALCHVSLHDRFMSATAIQRQEIDNVHCSIATIRRRLCEGGFKSYTPAKKTKLSLLHKANRLAWSVQHLHWRPEQWQSVIFSDESKFVIQQQHVRYVRRRIGERYQDMCVEERGNRSLGEVMIWAAFSYHGHTNVRLIVGRYCANDYINLLQDSLLPHYNRLLPQGGYFMQDNAPIHSANATSQFLQQNNIRLLPWPSLSPDMNPIENLWAICKSELKHHPVANRQQLLQAVQAIWNAKMTDDDVRHNLINSMTHRVRQLHIARGSYTRY